MTMEVKANRDQLRTIRNVIQGVSNRCERLDETTVNIEVADTDFDFLVDMVDSLSIEWRLV